MQRSEANPELFESVTNFKLTNTLPRVKDSGMSEHVIKEAVENTQKENVQRLPVNIGKKSEGGFSEQSGIKSIHSCTIHQE